MNYMNQEEQEYIRFMSELVNKTSEIAKEYNKLSDKNKYCICLFLEQVLWTSIVLNSQ